MYNLNDTIVAISSPPSGARAIVRITGPKTVKVCDQLFCSPITSKTSGVTTVQVAINTELKVDAKLYLFLAPHSYTGDDVAEIHLNTNQSVTEALMNNLLGSRKLVLSRVEGAGSLSTGLRMAGPGEFTARAYLNGKIDLAQAEAVNEIVVSSNTYQLAAAEKLLSGRLAETTKKVCSEIMDCLSLIEAGLDFSGEDIEFITGQQAVERLMSIKEQLEQLLLASSCESIIDLPAVGIAGAPNAGKSSLLNKLLGQERSIISDQRKTTRDVLTGQLSLAHCRCVLFDCAGLVTSPDNIIDELAQQAAIEAIRNSSMAVYCVDISKTDWSEDIAIRQFIEPRILVPVAAKCDLLPENELAGRLSKLNELFAGQFLPISVRTGVGLKQLQETIDGKIIEMFIGVSRMTDSAGRLTAEGRGRRDSTGRCAASLAGLSAESSIVQQPSSIVITARHRQAVTEAIESIREAIKELKAGQDEVAAMILRAAYQILSNIESEHIDEKILQGIFSRFCIGK